MPVCDEADADYQHEAMVPILCEGDIIGCVVLLQSDPKMKMGAGDQKMIQSAAGFLGRLMEQ